MKKIKLSNNRVVLVDNSDFDKISKHRWCMTNGYARRGTYRDGEFKNVYMHRQILNPRRGHIVDHVNGNKLDNRRANLRICTHSQNHANTRLSKANKTGFKGVFWHKVAKKYVAQIRKDGRTLYLGVFTKKRDAALRYNQEAVNLFGTFARINHSI